MSTLAAIVPTSFMDAARAVILAQPIGTEFIRQQIITTVQRDYPDMRIPNQRVELLARVIHSMERDGTLVQVGTVGKGAIIYRRER